MVYYAFGINWYIRFTLVEGVIALLGLGAVELGDQALGVLESLDVRQFVGFWLKIRKGFSISDRRSPFNTPFFNWLVATDTIEEFPAREIILFIIYF